MIDESEGYFEDDGTPFNPNLIPAPSLCAACKKNDNPQYEISCNLIRADQDEDIFICFAYASILGAEETKSVLKEMEDYLDQEYGKSEESRGGEDAE